MEGWSRSPESPGRSSLPLCSETVLNGNAHGRKNRAVDTVTPPWVAAPRPQGEQTTTRQRPNQAPPLPVSVALPPVRAWGCPTQEGRLLRHRNLLGGVMGFEV